MILVLKFAKPFHERGPFHMESVHLLCKSMDWLLYDRDLRHERVNNYLVTENEFNHIRKIRERLQAIIR